MCVELQNMLEKVDIMIDIVYNGLVLDNLMTSLVPSLNVLLSFWNKFLDTYMLDDVFIAFHSSL
jgi:hypothetical protein